jgi:hypothetical protein
VAPTQVLLCGRGWLIQVGVSEAPGTLVSWFSLMTWKPVWPRWKPRVRQLANRVRHSEQDAAAARVLAGGADRDVSEIRGEIRDFRQATTSSFNATREDLTDLRSEMQYEFAEMHGKRDAAAAGQQEIVNLLNTIITQGDQRNDQA